MKTTPTQEKILKALTAQLDIEDLSMRIEEGFRGRVYLMITYSPNGHTMLDVVAYRLMTIEIGKRGSLRLVSDSDAKNEAELAVRRGYHFSTIWRTLVDGTKSTDKILQAGRTKRAAEGK